MSAESHHVRVYMVVVGHEHHGMEASCTVPLSLGQKYLEPAQPIKTSLIRTSGDLDPTCHVPRGPSLK